MILPISELKAGMIIESPIVTRRGQSIASAGTVLTQQLIARLNFYKITEVDVSNPNDDVIVEKKPPVEEKEDSVVEEAKPKAKYEETLSYSQKLRQGDKFQTFQMNYSLNIAELTSCFDRIIAGDTDISETALLKSAETLFRSKTAIELFDYIALMKALDDSIYAHSINVALISRAIGKWLKLPKSELNELTLAGLLHDIGKTQIPKEVLEKSGKLTDEEFDMIKSHPVSGRKLLKSAGFSSDIQYAALQHHERSDGSGYPRGLDADEISDFAAIIAIADVYDAMTCNRSYRQALCAFQVIAAFEEDGLKKYNTKFILTFLERIAASYQNSLVMLSDGRTGKVVYINKSKLSRPIVQIDEDTIIDLSKELDISITQIL